MEHKEYDIGNGKKVSAYYRGNEATEVSKEAFEQIIIPALEKQEKYGWHDLRKDPEDLPKDEGIYLIAYSTNGGIHNHYMVEVFNKEWVTVNIVITGDVEVIAWREIEPFKKEE